MEIWFNFRFRVPLFFTSSMCVGVLLQRKQRHAGYQKFADAESEFFKRLGNVFIRL